MTTHSWVQASSLLPGPSQVLAISQGRTERPASLGLRSRELALLVHIVQASQRESQ